MKCDQRLGIGIVTILSVACMPALAHADGSGGPVGKNDECSPVRLDQPISYGPGDQVPGSMQFVQVRDQGSYSICFAEAAVEMLDAYRFSRLDDTYTNLQSSAIAATIDYSRTTGGDAFSGGSTCSVLNYLSTSGTVDDASVFSCILNFENRKFVSSLQQIYDRESNQLDREKQLLLSENLPSQELQSRYNQAKQSIYQADVANVQGLLASQGMSARQMPDAGAVVTMLDLSLPRMAWGLAAYSCASRSQSISSQIPLCMDSVLQSDSSFIAAWNSRLNILGAEPVEISYCDPVLKEGRAYAGVTRNGNSHQCAPSTTTTSPNHASLIIGRRRNPQTGACQYLVRNSWGTACKVSQIPAAPGNAPKDSSPQPTETGTDSGSFHRLALRP